MPKQSNVAIIACLLYNTSDMQTTE